MEKSYIIHTLACQLSEKQNTAILNVPPKEDIYNALSIYSLESMD